ncbi:MAG: hypothetical protein WDA22_16360 [Bacteroidota bacterium]
MRTFPTLSFFRQKFVDPVLFNSAKIVDHAHAVFRSISLIELAKSFTGEMTAEGKTEFFSGSFQLRTVFYDAVNARLRFVSVGTITSDAMMNIALMSHTESTIHSAGCNKDTRNNRMQ